MTNLSSATEFDYSLLETAGHLQALAFVGACTSDAEMEDCLKRSRKALPYPEWKLLLEEFSYVAEFYVDSKSRYVRRIANLVSIAKQTEKLKEEIIAAHTNDEGVLDLEGLQLTNNEGWMSCFFLKDASEVGKFRFSAFDHRGFAYHTARSTYLEVLDEAIKDGFKIPVKGKLEELSSNPEFFEYLTA